MDELKGMLRDIGNVKLVGDQLTVKDVFSAVFFGLVLFFVLGLMAVKFLPWWALALVVLFLMKGVLPEWEAEVLAFGKAMVVAVPLYFVLTLAMLAEGGLVAYFWLAGLVYVVIFALKLLKKNLFS